MWDFSGELRSSAVKLTRNGGLCNFSLLDLVLFCCRFMVQGLILIHFVWGHIMLPVR